MQTEESIDNCKNLYGKHKIIDGIEYKFCSVCHMWITLDNFPKRKDSKDGYRNQCKNCRNNNYKKWANNNIKSNIEKENTLTYKICTKCNENKDISEFAKCLSNPDGFQYWCKDCRAKYKEDNREHILEISKIYREQPKTKEYMKNYIKEYMKNSKNKQRQLENSKRWYKENINNVKEYYKNNKESILAKNKMYGRQYRKSEKYNSPKEIEKRKMYHKKWYEENHAEKLEQQKRYKESKQTSEYKEQQRLKAREYWYSIPKEIRQKKAKEYRLNNLKSIKLKDKIRYENNKISRCISRGIYRSIKENKAERHWENLVPYTLQELKSHLEKQFTSEMNWNNYGTYWEIDHIIPQNLFSFNSSEDKEFKICWSLANLRPLEKLLNRQRPKDGSDVSEELKQQILNPIVS